MFGFSKRLFARKQQKGDLAEELQYLVERYGDDVRSGIARELAVPDLTGRRRKLLEAARQRVG
jgi:hypothetical protein